MLKCQKYFLRGKQVCSPLQYTKSYETRFLHAFVFVVYCTSRALLLSLLAVAARPIHHAPLIVMVVRPQNETQSFLFTILLRVSAFGKGRFIGNGHFKENYGFGSVGYFGWQKK